VHILAASGISHDAKHFAELAPCTISKRTRSASTAKVRADDNTLPHHPESTYTTATMSAQAPQQVQCFGKKKTATAVAHCRAGKGLVKVNGKPLGLVEPQIMRFKVYEPILILGLDKFGM
jgi:hypothetical protein